MSIEEVRALVAERQRYDDWLAALEAKRAETPLRVFERVHGDYLGRRGEVILRLQSHIGALSDVGRDLEHRLGDLEARLALHEEELAEGMLRNLVGEYDGERWENVRQEIEARIAALGDERATLAVEVEDVQTLLASARTGPEAEPEPEPDAEPEPVLEEAAVVAVVTDAADALTMSDEATALSGDVWMEASVESAPSVDELLSPDAEPTAEHQTLPEYAPLQDAVSESAGMMVETIEVSSVSPYAVGTPAAGSLAQLDEDSLLDIDVSGMVDNPVPPAARHEDVLADVAALFDTSSITAVPAPLPLPEAPATTAEFDDALAMFGDVNGDADAEFLKSLEGIEADHDAPSQSNARVDVSFATATPPLAPQGNDPFDDLAFLRSVTEPGNPSDVVSPMAASPMSAASTAANEPQKTLRCTECGTMNLPTEWYCERCGGELAAF